MLKSCSDVNWLFETLITGAIQYYNKFNWMDVTWYFKVFIIDFWHFYGFYHMKIDLKWFRLIKKQEHESTTHIFAYLIPQKNSCITSAYTSHTKVTLSSLFACMNDCMRIIELKIKHKYFVLHLYYCSENKSEWKCQNNLRNVKRTCGYDICI